MTQQRPSSCTLTVQDHPLLDLRAFVTQLAGPLSDWPASHSPLADQALSREAALSSNDEVRRAIRDLLRHGGFKPTGRNKPASEYLIRAEGEGALSSINLAVDACNLVSLHSGLPISVVDLDLVEPPLRVEIAQPGDRYVFNQSGQTIDVAGLLCLSDARGPCANAVKDAQRTKTHPQTRRTLSLIWGTVALPGRCAEAEAWYRGLLQQQGARTETIWPSP